MITNTLTIQAIIAIVAGGILGAVIGFFVFKRIARGEIESAKKYKEKTINDAHRQAKTIKKEALVRAKDNLYQMKVEFEKETKDKREQLLAFEKRLYHKEETLDKKSEQYEKKEMTIANRERNAVRIEEDLIKKQKDLDILLVEQRRELERLAGISSREAKELLMKSMESEAKHDATKLIRRIDSEAKETAKRKAQETLALAVKRYAGEYVTEKTVSVVSLPNDEMKGRIIGREGRNIRAIEAATGVDLIIDDTPEAVVLSGFNPVRREVARISLERLMDDGRIHPARIEEIVNKVSKEIESNIKEAGEQGN